MGIRADIDTEWEGDWDAAFAALAWQVELGAVETIGEVPVDRYALPEPPPKPAAAAPPPRGAAPPPPAPPSSAALVDLAVQTARQMAERAVSLEALRDAISSYELCDLKKGARNTVFSDGNAAARVLILGEAPGREEDLEGRPFVGRAGQLLDRMFAAIGLDRQSPDPEHALYITNVMPWRPPANRDPSEEEIAMMRPFVERHIALADPDLIVVMGNTPLKALTGTTGILRARGHWREALGRPLLPMTHPAYLLRNPAAKREAWADLLSLQAQLRSKTGSRQAGA